MGAGASSAVDTRIVRDINERIDTHYSLWLDSSDITCMTEARAELSGITKDINHISSLPDHIQTQALRDVVLQYLQRATGPGSTNVTGHFDVDMAKLEIGRLRGLMRECGEVAWEDAADKLLALEEPNEITDLMKHCIGLKQHSVNGYYLTDKDLSMRLNERIKDLNIFQQRVFKMQFIIEQGRARTYAPIQETAVEMRTRLIVEQFPIAVKRMLQELKACVFMIQTEQVSTMAHFAVYQDNQLALQVQVQTVYKLVVQFMIVCDSHPGSAKGRRCYQSL